MPAESARSISTSRNESTNCSTRPRDRHGKRAKGSMTSRAALVRGALKTCASAALALLVSQPTEARAEDAWLGPDKALHFAAAGAIASIGYGVTTAVTDDRWKAFALGGGAAIGAGALKEAWDATGAGDPSW